MDPTFRMNANSRQFLLVQQFKEILATFGRHHVLESHLYPRPIFELRREFTREATADLDSGDGIAKFRKLAIEFAQRLTQYIVNEVSYDEVQRVQFAAAVAPFEAIRSALDSGQRPKLACNQIQGNLESICNISDLCKAVRAILANLLTGLCEFWDGAPQTA